VLAALVAGAAAAASAALVAREAGRAARGGAAAVQAAAAADGALAAAVGRWPARWGAALAPGARAGRDVTTAAGRARVWVVRLDGGRFALEAEGRSAAVAPADGPAVRRHALLVRLRDVALAPAAAVTAGGPVRVAAAGAVLAADGAPDGWRDCGTPPAAGVGAAVAAPEVHAEPGSVVDGAVRTDPAAWAGALDPRFGDEGYATHAARAAVTVAAGGALSPAPAAGAAAAGAGDVGAEPCALTAASWGEPRRGGGAVTECEGALPAVHLAGGVARLRGPARFQGTLLVDGDLVVEGEVRGAGVVVVRGAVDASAGALVLDGALVAGGAVRLGAGSRVRASSCAASAAARYAAGVVPLARRAWAEVVR
jgi:hypothetical protein